MEDLRTAFCTYPTVRDIHFYNKLTGWMWLFEDGCETKQHLRSLKVNSASGVQRKSEEVKVRAIRGAARQL